jgi:hypothetical protein
VISRELPTPDAGAPDRCVSSKALRRRFSLEYQGGMSKRRDDDLIGKTPESWLCVDCA